MKKKTPRLTLGHLNIALIALAIGITLSIFVFIIETKLILLHVRCIRRLQVLQCEFNMRAARQASNFNKLFHPHRTAPRPQPPITHHEFHAS